MSYAETFLRRDSQGVKTMKRERRCHLNKTIGYEEMDYAL